MAKYSKGCKQAIGDTMNISRGLCDFGIAVATRGVVLAQKWGLLNIFLI